MNFYTVTGIFTMLAGFSWIVLSYDHYAKLKNWHISKWYKKNTSLIKIAAIISLPGSALISAYLFHWLSPFIVLIIGFCLAQILTSIFKKNVQYIGLAGVPVFLFICIIILHNI